MENTGIFDPNDYDIFVLQCVYLPLLNKSLEVFTKGLNLHTEIGLQTINNMIHEEEVVTSEQVLPNFGFDALPDDEIGTPEYLCPLWKNNFRIP